MTILKPDNIVYVGGIIVNTYLLTDHNLNDIDMPSGVMSPIGITIHNTDWINIAAETTPAEQYTRATVNGNMKDTRVHYYVDDTCAWQNLPLSLPGWHAADGNGDGNRRTIAIECIMGPDYNDRDRKSEDNCARLAASLLKQYSFGVDRLYTHNHWYSTKYCPAYILPHWNEFVEKVNGYLNSNQTVKTMYRIRKTWTDIKSQIGAFTNLEGAKKSCVDGYSVFDENGTKVYPEESTSYETASEAVSNKINMITVNMPLICKGNTGKAVRVLQSLLIALKYDCGSYGVDGDFGNSTKNAVLNYQRDHHITIDGIVGQETWTSLLT